MILLVLWQLVFRHSAFITELLFIGMAHDAPGSSHDAGSICLGGRGVAAPENFAIY